MLIDLVKLLDYPFITIINAKQVASINKRMFDRRNVEQTERDIEMRERVFEITRNKRFINNGQLTF